MSRPVRDEQPSGTAGSVRAALTLAASLVMLALATPADAAVFDLSEDPNAEKPDIAVDDAGTSHVVWNVQSEGFGDNTLVYCRVPRGARACASTQTWVLPGEISRQWVNITGDGQVLLTVERCCFAGMRLYMLSSGDGGDGFSAPLAVAETFWGWGEEVEPGPGDFSLSAAGGGGGCNDGVNYSAIPLSGVTTTWAAITASCFEGEQYASIGFPDPLTPLVAYRGWEAERVFFRRWSGSGDYNDAASWGPVTQVPGGGGDEPKLASGVRGVYLMFRAPKYPHPYHVRRYDGANFPSSSDRVVSDPKGGAPIFRDFFEDGDGSLHSVFLQRDEKEVRGLRQAVSTDGGKNWQLTAVARGKATEDLYNPRVGAAPDGGGAVVGDHNSDGPIWFAPFGPVAPGGGSCKPSIKVGGARVQALEGCFKRHAGTWVATGAVKVNGIDVEPAGGGGRASASAAFHVTATPGQRRLTGSGTARVRAGNVLLDRGPVDWKLPKGSGKVVRLGSADGSVFPDLGKFAKKLFEFPVDGDAELLIAGSGTEIPVNLRMPGLLGGVTGNTTLHTSKSGFSPAGLELKVPTAAIGLLHLGDIEVSYDGQNRFSGSAKVELPPSYSGGISKSSVQFGFEDGELSLLKVTPPPFTPTLPIVGSPPTPVVGLDQVAFSYVRKPGSRLFQGDVTLLGGPKPGGHRAVTVDGAVTLEFPQSKPTTLSASGTFSLVKVPLGSAHATYTVPSTLEFGGGFELLSISGAVDGFVDLAHKTFSASGSAHVGPLSGEAVVTQDGFGACIDNPLGPDPGISWEWGDALPTPSCPGSGVFGRSARPAGGAGAFGLARPGVTSSVRGSGRRRMLRFNVSTAPGQRVTFAEQGKRVYREIGTTRRARGAFRFHPAPGPGGKRSIVAIVEQGKVPRAKLTVARYEAPPTRRLPHPRRATARRRDGRLVVGWAAVKEARGYEVRVALPRDGRRLLFFAPAKRHRLRVRGIERSDTGRITVAAIGPDLRPGHAAKAKLKPLRKQRHRRRR